MLQRPWIIHAETSEEVVAVVSRPPCFEPKAREQKTSAWRPKLRPPTSITAAVASWKSDVLDRDIHVLQHRVGPHLRIGLGHVELQRVLSLIQCL